MKTKKPNTTLNEEMTTLQDQVKILDENWKRALADYQNLAKRIEADKRDFVKFATANIIAKLVPTLDILELAAKHSNDPGVQMAVKQISEVLAAEGMQEIVPAPQTKFDHNLHECSEVVPGEPEDTVAELVTKGYKIDSFVIKPAKVKVFKKI